MNATIKEAIERLTTGTVFTFLPVSGWPVPTGTVIGTHKGDKWVFPNGHKSRIEIR